ncbi:MAG: type IV pilus assembly protein PilB [Parcubacteria group bacterium Gr01-1014_31]|nr:MAG: type IV pilus assembly protein PilB [Parcubacteria group bacterium Gr01-1014_31]
MVSMHVSDEQLKEALVSRQLLPASQVNAAFAKAEAQHLSLREVLLNDDLIADEHVGRLIADLLGVPFINLRKVQIPEAVLRLIPEVVAKSRQVIAVKRDREGLTVAMADPDDMEAVALVQKATGELVTPALATPRDLGGALSRYRKGLQEDFSALLTAAASEAEAATKEQAVEQAEATVVRIVEQLLAYAYENKASDLHLEPQRDALVVRFRIDGVLHEVVALPKAIEPQIVSRIKVLSKLRTDEHAAAQDGKFRFSVPEEQVDVRVSILPVTAGEKVVLRLLSSKQREFSLEDLGFGAGDLKKVKLAFNKPYGMILSTGPTGCGKTTTLYAILQILNSREINISTIEDPVEYEIAGVNQIQVNAKTNLTFAAGLRSILRQDPDVIMVGEIRDEEAAGIAVNAAMTGHLVLSTLHTNDAATSLPRLLDMQVEPFLISSTVNVIVAQRLVRRICSQCLVSYQAKRKELGATLSPALVTRHFGNRASVRLYKGKGCQVCGGTGYHGRVGIFEVLEVTEAVRRLIMERANADIIKAEAVKEGMTTMLDDGLAKAVQGATTIEEVLRATRE